MAGQTVPNDQQLAGNVAQQVREKLDDLPAADGAGKQPEIEVPPRHTCHRRQRLPVEVILQQVRQRCGRWLSPLSSMAGRHTSPTAPAQRRIAKSTVASLSGYGIS